jgi:hypothetical protein
MHQWKRSRKAQDVSSNQQPKPIDELPDLQGQVPGPIPLQVLQGWGIDCGVPPEVITKEALLQGSNNDDK